MFQHLIEGEEGTKITVTRSPVSNSIVIDGVGTKMGTVKDTETVRKIDTSVGRMGRVTHRLEEAKGPQ